MPFHQFRFRGRCFVDRFGASCFRARSAGVGEGCGSGVGELTGEPSGVAATFCGVAVGVGVDVGVCDASIDGVGVGSGDVDAAAIPLFCSQPLILFRFITPTATTPARSTTTAAAKNNRPLRLFLTGVSSITSAKITGSSGEDVAADSSVLVVVTAGVELAAGSVGL